MGRLKAIFTGFGYGCVFATLAGIYKIYFATEPSHHDEYPLLRERNKINHEDYSHH
jgi:hypothetical protein